VGVVGEDERFEAQMNEVKRAKVRKVVDTTGLDLTWEVQHIDGMVTPHRNWYNAVNDANAWTSLLAAKHGVLK
jgi:hypothetical protein